MGMFLVVKMIAETQLIFIWWKLQIPQDENR